MIASSTSDQASASYDLDQNTVVDSVRGSLMTDVQMSADETPMPSSSIQMALNDVTRHDITSILERPVNLGTFEWSTGSTQQIPFYLPAANYTADTASYLNVFNFPQDIFTNSPLAVDKLKNYQYFKADVEIEVKINAQPFLQGALMLVYNPYYNETNDFRRKGTRFMASQTSCPYKIVSIEEGNSLKLTCPYANIYDMFDLSNSANQFGTVFLYVFSALIGPTATETCKYTVFARFKNPEFYVPTQNDVLSTYRDAHEIKRLTAKGHRFAQASVEPVSARDTGEVMTTGPVSKLASGVSMVADVLSGVPVIGKIASSVAWVSRCISKTAASFGWSKPTSIHPQMKAVLKPNTTLIHTEGNDDATTLALLQDNGIDGSSFIPETKDEMSLSYIFGRPNYFLGQTATSTLFSNRNLITKWEVSPFSQYQYGDPADQTTLFLGSFAYASMMGSLWRGTINYDIKVIKTPYHQGRFVVVFLPETNLADVPDTLGDLNNTNYNVVCNLKDRQDELGRTDFRVSVPFISNTPWRETFKLGDNPSVATPDATTLETKTGCCAIYSLVDLSFPPTVTPSVVFYVAHSGGEDYQISRPTNQLSPGFFSLYAQADIGPVHIPVDENLLVPSHTMRDVTAQTTGEYFQSLRAIMKRFNLLGYLSRSPNFVGLRTRHVSENPRNGRRTMSRINLTDYVLPTSWYMTSFLYRFYHGSSQLKIFPSRSTATCEAYVRFDDDPTDQRIFQPADSFGQPLFQQPQTVSNVFEVRSPYYRGIRCDVVGSDAAPILGDVRTCVRTRYGNGAEPADIFEAAGDDFNFFFLIGPPPMFPIKNVTLTSTFPTGSDIQLDLSAVVDFSAPPIHPELRVSPITEIPALVDGNVYGITQGSGNIVVTYDDTTTQTIPITDCTIWADTPHQLRIPTDPLKILDATATLAAITALPILTIRAGFLQII